MANSTRIGESQACVTTRLFGQRGPPCSSAVHIALVSEGLTVAHLSRGLLTRALSCCSLLLP